MIVQCEHCQTKYRIPDEKIKGKVAKVRCNKCNNIFTIHPEGDVPAAATAEKAQPAAEVPPPASEPLKAAPPEQEAQPSATAEPPDDSELSPPVSPPEQPFSTPATERPDIPTTPLEENEGFSREEADDLLKSLSEDVESPSLPENADGTRSLRPAHEFDRSGPAARAEEEAPQPALDEFQIESTLREDQSEPLPTSPAPTTEPAPGASPPTDEEMGWGNIALESEPDRQQEGEEIGLAGGADYQPPPPSPPIFDEEPGETPESWTEPESAPASTPSYSDEKTAPRKGRMGLFIILLLAAFGAVGYFAYPKVMEIINPQAKQPVGTLTPDKIQVRSLSREDGNLIYTVRGVVRNDSSESVGMVQVEAQFRNAAGTVVAKSNVFCGNIFEDNEILSGDLGKILNDLQNELGQSLSNNNIKPGQFVPFLLVLENPPPDISKVTVTISGFKETT